MESKMKKSEVERLAYIVFCGVEQIIPNHPSSKILFNKYLHTHRKDLKEFIVVPTLKEISHKVYYSMGVYSQLVIDIIENIEDEEELTETIKSGYRYEINNLLEIIDKTRKADIEVLNELIEWLDQ